ncbi:MAG: DUF2490 domain-containing protein [Bacteroidales bacterium]|nr:DUF2490 domain-containing protein [Bacteroidales bacterium]
MNLKLRIKRGVMCAVAVAIAAMPCSQAFANDDSDDFGVWTSIDASKKLSDKIKLGLEGEFRTTDGLKIVDRRSLGVGLSYKPYKWLKADVGYIFMNAYEPEKTSIKDEFAEGKYDYNVDNAYRVNKERLYLSVTGSFDVGRLEFSIRERLQYTYTHPAATMEDKHRWEREGGVDGPIKEVVDTDAEYKGSKNNTTLRSRLTVKWDIRKCPIKPFVSAELFTRVDEWRFHDKIRYRAGVDYKIDKDNSVSLFYIYQNANDDDEPAGHAIGASYSFDL